MLSTSGRIIDSFETGKHVIARREMVVILSRDLGSFDDRTTTPRRRVSRESAAKKVAVAR